MIPIRRLLLITGCLALLVGGAVSTALPANAALFPAIGTYQPSSGQALQVGVPFHGEVVTADIVTINPRGAPRFEIIVQYTNDTSSFQTDDCVLPNGHLKVPSDTRLIINGKVTLKGIDSTCGKQPRYKDVLAPGQTDTYFVAFPLPPALGAIVQVSSLFGTSTGGVARYTSAPFDPYTSTTTLKITKFSLSPAVVQVLLDAHDLWTDGRDMVNNLSGIEVFGHESITVLDANLLLPWVACPINNQQCVLNSTPAPYLPVITNE
jgi:hypothetical protein